MRKSQEPRRSSMLSRGGLHASCPHWTAWRKKVAVQGWGYLGCPAGFREAPIPEPSSGLWAARFPWILCQMNSLGEPPRATRHLALPCGGQATLGKITRVYVSSDLLLEILWMGQWVLPGTGGCSGFCPHRYPKVPGHLAWTYQASPLNNLSTSEARGGPLDSVCAS